jgi:hypothetical protein
VDGAGMTIPESGGVVFNFPAVEQFGEFRILTNNFNAEYGRTGGGIEIFTTASGTNNFHGTVFDFHRNNVLDANSWANNAARRPRNKYRQNELGAAIGGPAWIPKLYDGRNRTFFFFTFNGYRQNSAATPLFVTLPTTAMRQQASRGVDIVGGSPVPVRKPACGQRAQHARRSLLSTKATERHGPAIPDQRRIGRHRSGTVGPLYQPRCIRDSRHIRVRQRRQLLRRPAQPAFQDGKPELAEADLHHGNRELRISCGSIQHAVPASAGSSPTSPGRTSDCRPVRRSAPGQSSW